MKLFNLMFGSILAFTCVAQAGLLIDEGFEDGTIAFDAAYANHTALSNAPTDTWVSRQNSTLGGTQVDTEWASQTDAAAIRWQHTAFIASFQYIDVSSLGDLTGETVSIHADIGCSNPNGGAGQNGAQLRLIGFNDPSTVTVDLANDVSPWGGTGYTELYSTALGFGVLSTDGFTTYGADDIALATDYNYFAVLVGGNAKTAGNYIAADNVVLTTSVIPEPATLGLVAMAAAGLIGLRRVFMV